MPQGSKQKMSHKNVHKALGRSQLRKTDTGALERNSSTRTRPVGQPHTVRHGAPKQMMPQGIKRKMDHSNVHKANDKRKMGHPNVHKAPGWSQFIKIDMGALEQNGPNRTHPVG